MRNKGFSLITCKGSLLYVYAESIFEKGLCQGESLSHHARNIPANNARYYLSSAGEQELTISLQLSYSSDSSIIKLNLALIT